MDQGTRIRRPHHPIVSFIRGATDTFRDRGRGRGRVQENWHQIRSTQDHHHHETDDELGKLFYDRHGRGQAVDAQEWDQSTASRGGHPHWYEYVLRITMPHANVSQTSRRHSSSVLSLTTKF